ncbi:hypothetical protein MSAN_00461100 [Mycena sanguinolenta]|uniref:Uncharacterized protein n=1 Tax=Mycena sanguinolenta TaxID=230812 RepID=A0A8H7DLL4_9AGAR|nr:hypothetical protein MSAN_00461100 [Mycena sanguinolenta]
MPLLSSLLSGLAVATLASEKAVPLSSHTTSCGIFGLPFPTWIPLLSGPCTPPPPTGLQSQTCFIRVKDTTGKDYGYLKPEWSNFGLYNQFCPTIEDALKVSFEYDPSAPSGFSMKAVNTPESQAAFPFLGAFTCSWDDGIVGGPEKFAPMAGVPETPQGSTPVSGENSFTQRSGETDTKFESAIWNYDSDTQELTTQWINLDEDKTIVATQIVYIYDFAQQPLVLTDDPEGLNAERGANYPEMTFTCEPTTS